MTGGPCQNADGSPGLFVQLDNSSCKPVIVTGKITIAINGSKRDCNAAGECSADLAGTAHEIASDKHYVFVHLGPHAGAK